MDEREQPRTWVLSKTIYDYTNETSWEGPPIPDFVEVRVVELEPILDLMELMLTEGIPLFPEHKKVQSVAGMATDFLIVHGRLKVDV